MLERDTGERKDYAARYEELIDLVEAEELEVTEKEEAAVDAKTVVAESAAGEQKAMTQIEEEPAMMNPTILEEVQMRYRQQQGRLYVRYVAENLCFERHAAEQIQENNFMAVPVSRGADTY